MILIIDFGSQYNQLIARRVREHRIYCRIEPPRSSTAEIKALAPEGIILSGGPASIYEENSPRVDIEIFDLGIPILGICYGMQYMADALGGEVKKAEKREYGLAELRIKNAAGIFSGIEKKTKSWMSHGVDHTPKGKGMLKNFLFATCKCKKTWTMKSFIKESIKEVKCLVGDKKVILG
ncbi:MAG: glutamine-hydrolyzing GMP synthase, partial [Thermodesulfobacteriota bacterium]|nr:glutamine-hydrolyzing GMP synthase [Thermodesulfobacteriota bacterium]